MAEAELPGVKHLAGKISGTFTGVKFVAEDGMAEVMKVNADLVGPATVQSAFHEAHVAARTEDSIFGFR